MERFEKIRKILWPVFWIIVALMLIIRIGTSLYSEHIRVQKLKQQDYYHLYFTYIAVDNEYNSFYMLNNESDNIEDTKDLVAKIVNDEFINSLRNEKVYKDYGEHKIRLYFMLPSKELPYGWQKSELNIQMNFDRATFYCNTKVLVIVPVNAKNVDDCIIEDYPHA